MSFDTLRDVSNNNSLTEADFARFKKQGVVGVYLKRTEGLDFVDERAPQFRAWAKKHGLLYGEYHFFHPNVDGDKQAHFFLAHTHDDAELVPALDLEVTDGEPWALVERRAEAWLKRVNGTLRVNSLLYTYPDFATNVPGLVRHPLWISDPDRRGNWRGPRIFPWRRYVLWQDVTTGIDADRLRAGCSISRICRPRPKVKRALTWIQAFIAFRARFA